MQGASVPVQGSSSSSPPPGRSTSSATNAEKSANRRSSIQQSQPHIQIEKLQSQYQRTKRSNSGSSSSSSLQQARNELQNGIVDRSPLPSNAIFLPEEDARSIVSTNSSTNSRRRGMSTSSQSHMNAPSSPRPRSSSVRGPALQGTASPPSTPRLSSRSKILASSAILVDGVASPPLPYAYRSKTEDLDLSTSAESPKRSYIQGQQHMNRRLPSSPPSFLQGKESLTAATGGLSLADRKRRLASASGEGSTFGHERAGSTSAQSPSIIRRRESEANASPSSSKGPMRVADAQWADGTMTREDKKDKGDDTKSISGRSGFRKRFSELRGNLFGEGQNSATTSSSSSDTAIKDHAKEEVPSSFSASIDGKRLQQTHLEVPPMQSRPSFGRQQSQASTQSSTVDTDGGSVGPRKYVNAQEAPIMESTASEDTSHSWITSLSSVSPPEIPDFSNLQFNLPSPHSPASPSAEDRTKQLQRTSSWPPDETRRGSFVSVKGQGAGTGYRFENAANQAKRSPTSEKGVLRSPDSMRSVDLLLQSRENKGRKYSDTSNPQSPSMLDFSQLFIPPSHRSSSISSSQWETPRMPVISVQNSSSVIEERESGEKEQISSPVAIDYKAQHYPRNNRSGSMHSINSQQASPVHHTPRNSSLILGGGNRSPTTPAMSASSRNSYMTVHSSSAMHDGWNAPENVKDMIHRREEKRRSASYHKATGSASPNDADALGLTNRIEENQRSVYDFGSSPTSMTTAPQDSPQLGLLGIMSEEVLPITSTSSASGENSFTSEEPKRPHKNPLRAASSSNDRSRQLSGGEGSTLVAAATAAQGRRMTSPPIIGGGATERVRHGGRREEERGTGSSEGTEEHKPLRRTLEGEMQPDSIEDSNDSFVVNDQLGETEESRASLASETGSNHLGKRSKQAGLDSAIQLDERGRRGFNALEDDESDDDKPDTETIASSQEYDAARKASPASSTAPASVLNQKSSHRKAAPSKLTSAFTRDKTTEKMKSPETVSPVSPGSGLRSKRMRVWPFGKDISAKESPLALLQVDSRESTTLGRASKMSKTLRSKKDNDSPTTNRPAITRVYREGLTTDRNIEVDESDYEVEDDTASIITNTEGQSAAWRKIDSSVPGTPIAVNEEMTPEMKRIIRRRNVIRELIDTERSYAADLVVVRDIYLARARSEVGLTLITPLSGYGTPPLSSPDVIVSINGTVRPTTPGYMSKSFMSRHSQKGVLNDMQSPSASPQITTPKTASVASPSSLAASSSVPSNRSSTYTVSSQTSQTSDTSFLPQSGIATPLPATPPNLTGLTTTGSASTLHSHSPASSGSTATVATSKTTGNRPKMAALNTNGLFLPPSGDSNGSLDPGLTLSDVRIIFSHLEACCAFAEDTASVLAGSMGTFARAKRVQPGDVKAEMDKGDDRLGEAFLNLMARIRSNFIDYCSRHETSMQRLQAVMTSSPKANLVLKECTEVARKYTNAWDLASLLIKPVQRVLKYPLLLQQILNCTPSTHADYTHLQHALEDMQGVADEINRVKKRRDLADHLITGRLKEVGKSDSSPSSVVSTFKSKKRSDAKMSKEMEGSMAALRAEDAAVDQYTSLTRTFYSLMESTRNMQEQCLEWSICLRESYNSQINVLLAMRRVYRLRVDEENEEGESKTREIQGSDYKDEIKLIKSYIKLLLKVLETAWQQADDAIRSEIVPTTMQISSLFESPRIVMSKRDDRLADYQKLRQSSQYGKQTDRKVSDNALGFVALNAQLVEDLPLFLVGVQSLLDAAVRKFAHIQATHFDQVRRSIVEFWNEKAKKKQDIVLANDGSGQSSLRHVNITKAFWDRHSVSAAWMDSLSMAHRRKSSAKGISPTEEHDSLGSSNVSTPGANGNSQATSSTITSHEMKKSFSSKRSITASTSSHSTTSTDVTHDDSSITAVSSSRHYGSKPSLLRSISGPISKKKSIELLPPLPLGTNFKQTTPTKSSSYATSIASTSSKKERHKDLIYQVQDGKKSFIQLQPIAFLDATDGIKRTPLTASEGNNGSTNSAFKTSRSTSQQSNPQFKRQMIHILQERESKVDVYLPPLEERRWHHDWPYINFAKGDILQVICTEDINAESVHFGRIERTGDIGWAYARCFRERSGS